MIKPPNEMLISDVVDAESALRFLEGHAQLEDKRGACSRARELRRCIEVLRSTLVPNL